MKEFLRALKEAERILQEATDFLLKYKGKVAGEQEKELAQKLISLIKSTITLLERYKEIKIDGFETHNISAVKSVLESLQTKLGEL